MNKRKVWVEPLFAEAKDWHGLRRFRLRLLWRVNIEALRIATGQNLKRLLKKRGWGRRPFPTEAFCASFLAAFGWFARPSLRYASVSSFIGSHCPVNRWSISHLTDEFCGRVFQQAGNILQHIVIISIPPAAPGSKKTKKLPKILHFATLSLQFAKYIVIAEKRSLDS